MSSNLISNQFIPQRLNMPWRQLAEDRAMLLNLDSGEYFELHGSAPFIWKCLDGESCIAEIVLSLIKVYGIEEQRAQDDVTDFVQELQKNNLLSDTKQSIDDEIPKADIKKTGLSSYKAPMINTKGNLKYLGQLD